MSFHFEEGEVLLVDKPSDWTSFDIVNFTRSLIKRFHQIPKLKVGHAGTLDPLATGLLILCTGKMTKRIQDFQDQDKEYTGTIRLGMTTPSYDLESEADATFPTESISAEMIEKARQSLLGDQMQMPPIYSAIKIDGKRAFLYARKNKDVQLTPRSIRINYFELDTRNFPDVDFVVGCSKGTYIRSLAHDFGKALGNGGCLAALRRTKIGDFNVDDALTPEALKKMIIDTAPAADKAENS